MRRPTWTGIKFRAQRQTRGWIFRLHTQQCGRRLLVARGARVSRVSRHTHLILGDHVSLMPEVAFHFDAPGATITIGDNTYLNRRTEVSAAISVSIGANCAIGWDVLILDHDGHALPGRADGSPVQIGDRVWIGARAIVMQGVTIGSGAVVGAGSVVTADVPPRSVVAGVPARVVRENVDWGDSPLVSGLTVGASQGQQPSQVSEA